MDDQADHGHRMSLLQTWCLTSVYCNCSCSSCQFSLCLAVYHTHTQGFCHIIRTLEEAANTEMMRCKCVTVTVQNPLRRCQGMNRTSLHTANQCTAQLCVFFILSTFTESFAVALRAQCTAVEENTSKCTKHKQKTFSPS